MKDRFAGGNQRSRMNRYGSETIGGEIPRELYQPPRRRDLSKDELRQQFADAWVNAANLPPVQRIPPKRGGR